MNATLAVDTFFMISGLVTVISFARRCKSANSLVLTGKLSEIDKQSTNVERQQKHQHLNRISLMSSASSASSASSPNSSSTGSSSSSSSSASDILVHSSLETACELTGSSESDCSGCTCCQLQATGAGGSTQPIIVVEDNINSGDSETSSSKGTTTTSRSLLASSSSKRYLNSSSNKRKLDQKETKKPETLTSDFQPLVWLLMRYIRLTPSYATLIGLSILLPSLGAPGGPFWPETMGQLEPSCRSNWWSNLLFVNNFYETDKLCLIHSWYLSNDWQFFTLALILLGLMYKSRKLALLMLITIFLASSATTFTVIVQNEFPPTIVTTSPAVAERWQFIHKLYYKPWPHLPPYLIGLIVGYLIVVHQKQQSLNAKSSGGLIIPPGWRYACWFLFGSVALALLNSIYPWNMGLQVDPLISGLHGSTFRTLWAACNAWLVFALVVRSPNSRQGALGRLLSWRGFQVTSRLTYCAYLVHPLIIYYHFGSLRERMDSSLYGQTCRFMATLLLSYIGAFALSLLVESPSIELQKFIVKLFSENNSSKTKENNKEKTKHNNNKSAPNEFDWIQAGDYPRATATTHHHYKIKHRNRRCKSTALTSRRCNKRHHHHDHHTSNHHHHHHHHQHNKQRFSQSSRLQSKRKLASNVLGNEISNEAAVAAARQSSPSNSAIDEQFQRKLAQAIGRGFKIRSKMVATSTPVTPSLAITSSSGQQLATRRLAAAKGLPGESQSVLTSGYVAGVPDATPTSTNASSASSHMRSDQQQQQQTSQPPPPPPPPVVSHRQMVSSVRDSIVSPSRRAESMTSTFVSNMHQTNKL